ncbi:ABC transporter substrate-binding protein [Persephonella sp.]
MRIFLKIFAVAVILFTVNCLKTGSDYLKIGTNVWPGYEPLYLSRELGFLNNKYIHLVEYSSASQVLRSYRNGIINGAALTLDEVLLLKSFGFNPKIVLVMDISDGADVIIGKPYVRDLKDLKGKRVGVESSALGAYMLSRALEKAGLTESDIKIVPLEIDEHYKAFIKNKIDAVVTFEPVKSKLLKHGGKILFDSSQIPKEIVDVLVVEESYIKNHPEVVQDLVDGWFKALKYWEENKDEALKIMAKREGISPEHLNKMYEGLKIPDIKMNKEMINGKEPSLKIVAYNLLKIMKKNQIINNTHFDVNTIFEGRFLRER